MKIFKTPQEAIAYVKKTCITSDRDSYIDDIINKGICKMSKVILVVDEHNLLGDTFTYDEVFTHDNNVKYLVRYATELDRDEDIFDTLSSCRKSLESEMNSQIFICSSILKTML